MSVKKLTPEQKQAKAARQRLRRAEPDYKNHRREQQRAYRARRQESISLAAVDRLHAAERMKNRRADPDTRAHMNELARAGYERNKNKKRNT